MRSYRLIACCAALVPLTAALAPRGTAITFAPEAGLSLTKTYSQELNAELSDLTFSMNDEEVEVEELPTITITSNEVIVLTDSYDAVDEGRPTKLTRVFDELTRSRVQVTEEDEMNIEETSELEGLSVTFLWDEDESAYIASFTDEDESADEDLLAELFGDADMLGFLPRDEVEVGDTWSVELDDYRRLFSPSGELTFMDGDDEPSRDEIDDRIDENLEGEIECTFMGVEEVDDVRMGVIEFTIELESEGETSEEMEVEDEEIDSATESRTITIDSEYEGTLYFNLAAGHIASVTIVGESNFSVKEGVLIVHPEFGEFTQSQTMFFEGELEGEITFE
ncbi:MAG: hypothetical protein ACJAVJ_001384 [Planctomycetota bacterium]|jgi:hypothetical protein